MKFGFEEALCNTFFIKATDIQLLGGLMKCKLGPQLLAASLTPISYPLSEEENFFLLLFGHRHPITGRFDEMQIGASAVGCFLTPISYLLSEEDLFFFFWYV
ncbi:hypothetical protein CEXT_338501 [Caerostris extrusa]|uniref:Uncharacterized protein n=1 Tax=Caerostris extrusa TaxID=172846 RepID=A0AAV4WJM0_CAEEX|nr:hypothetical protein CEXT_338501 [Caerostris extrusa]